MHKVIIDKNLKFDYDDLLLDVDLSHEFTLRNVLDAVSNSKVPIKTLKKILRCNYLEEYCKEVNIKPYKDYGDIEYLRLSLIIGSDYEPEEVKEWRFDGVGIEGNVSEDVLPFIPEKDRATYREHYSVELSPMWKLADLKIKINHKIHVNKPKFQIDEYIAMPSITLVELLYAIFWEISWFGNIKKRNNAVEKLRKSVKELKKENGKIGRSINKDLARLKKKFKEK